jgi:hypothetical protein
METQYDLAAMVKEMASISETYSRQTVFMHMIAKSALNYFF